MDTTEAPAGAEETHEHKVQLGKALQEALTCGEHAQLSDGHLDQVGALLLTDGSPAAILAWHGGDVVAADDHLQALYADLVVLQQRAKDARKKAHGIGKRAEKLQYGIDKLYGQLRVRAEEERQQRRTRQSSFGFTGDTSLIDEDPPDEPAKGRGRGRKAGRR